MNLIEVLLMWNVIRRWETVQLKIRQCTCSAEKLKQCWQNKSSSFFFLLNVCSILKKTQSGFTPVCKRQGGCLTLDDAARLLSLIVMHAEVLGEPANGFCCLMGQSAKSCCLLSTCGVHLSDCCGTIQRKPQLENGIELSGWWCYKCVLPQSVGTVLIMQLCPVSP